MSRYVAQLIEPALRLVRHRAEGALTPRLVWIFREKLRKSPVGAMTLLVVLVSPARMWGARDPSIWRGGPMGVHLDEGAQMRQPVAVESHVVLRLQSDTGTASHVTTVLGIDPDEAYEVGDPIPTRKGRTLDVSRWHLESSADMEEGVELVDSIVKVLERI
jgi:Domain of unknown function (DUF4279)